MPSHHIDVVGELIDTIHNEAARAETLTASAELDYQHEAQQATILAAELAGFPDVIVPEIVRDLSGDDLILMDLIEGVPLTDLDAIKAAGLDRHELARIVLKRNPTMIMFDDRFHADPGHDGSRLG
jgi:ubiquinone biosynthesis protein